MVKEPVVTTTATAAPLIIPSNPEATTATFAGPPLLPPASALAISLKNLPMPHLFIISPNAINRNMYVDATLTDEPYIPSVLAKKWLISFCHVYPLWRNMPGILTGIRPCFVPIRLYKIKITPKIGSAMPHTRLVASSTSSVSSVPIITSMELGFPARLMMLK